MSKEKEGGQELVNNSLNSCLCLFNEKYDCLKCIHYKTEPNNMMDWELRRLKKGVPSDYDLIHCKRFNLFPRLQLRFIIRELKNFKSEFVEDNDRIGKMLCVNQEEYYCFNCEHHDDNWCEGGMFHTNNSSLMEKIRKLKGWKKEGH